MMRDNRAVNIRPEAQTPSPPNRVFEGGAPIGGDHHQQESSTPGATQLAAKRALTLAEFVEVVYLRRRDLGGKALFYLPRLAEQDTDPRRRLTPPLTVFKDFVTRLHEMQHLAQLFIDGARGSILDL